MDEAEYAALLRANMASLALSASRSTAIGATLRGATDACVKLIAGTHSADILVIVDGTDYQSMAATSPLAETLDRAQQHFGEGPCVNAATGDTVVRCDDLRDDSRWPRFAKSAVDVGVRSMMSFQLFTHDDRVAALNVVGEEADCFGAEAEALGAMFATHCAIAMIADTKEHQFKSALATRDVIGQAKGRIMERFDVDAVRAFDLLKQLSQETNTKLTDVAAKIATDRSDTPVQR